MKTIASVFLLALLSAVANAQTSIWHEAECAQVGSLWNRTNDTGASNSQYVVIQPGNNSTANAPTNTAGHINFPFSVGTAGTYRLFARMQGPTANDDSFWVRMDGGTWVMWNNWWNPAWIWVQGPNTFNLSAGSHTLSIAYREDGARLDKINITTSTALPTGTGSPATNCTTGTTLSVSPAAVSVAAAANSTGTFGVTSNTSWTVTDDQAWLTVSPDLGLQQRHGHRHCAAEHRHVGTFGDGHGSGHRRSIADGHGDTGRYRRRHDLHGSAHALVPVAA